MQTRLLIATLASMLIACGGSDSADDTTPARDDTTDTGDEAALEPGDGQSDNPEPDEVDDGSSCLPVSRCRSFANQGCALVNADGAVQGEDFSAGRVLEACPGGRGVSTGVTECFNYVELSAGCGRNLPDINAPAWPCGRDDAGGCTVQM